MRATNRLNIRLAILASLVFILPCWGQTSQPAEDGIEKIAFAIPGSKVGTTSQAIVALPAECRARIEAGKMSAPQKAKTQGSRWPVVYLLHGYSGNCDDWYKHTKGTDRALGELATRFGLIIVLPDGKFGSWYLDAASDAPDSADWQWETVITKHLVPEIDRRYPTWAEPAGRGITGLSMGGHGSIYLCARHPELFSACGSMSGALDLRPLKDKYHLINLLGPYDKNPQSWLEHSATYQAERFAGRNVGVFIDCGLQDTPFIGVNQELHRKLLDLKVPHDYVERPGAHTWEYWVNALPYHLQFMTDRLKKVDLPADHADEKGR